MSWYKFLIYFLLFAAAICYVVVGIMLIAGTKHGEDRDMIYFLIDGLEDLEFFCGYLYLSLAVFAMVVRSCLKRRLNFGPVLLYVLLVATWALQLIYQLGLSNLTKEIPSYSSAWERLTRMGFEESGILPLLIYSSVTIIMVACNAVYFRKRAHLFKSITPKLTTTGEEKTETVKATVEETTKASSVRETAEALRAYKDLLDSGVLTQEEFDAKKKELLEM